METKATLTVVGTTLKRVDKGNFDSGRNKIKAC